MSKKVFYRYNPATDEYERVFPTKKERLHGLIRNLLFWIVICGAIFGVVYTLVGTPREKTLQRENEQLQAQLDIMNRRLDVMTIFIAS